MKQHKIGEFYEEYCKALDWAVALVDPIPDYCRRFFEYKEILEKQLNEFVESEKAKNTTVPEMREHAEAFLEACALVDIHKRFFGRTDREFKVKLRESFFGPQFASDEEKGGKVNKGSFGRNIQSELILASRFKYLDKVSFGEHDVVYDLGDTKFGIEVKRIQEESGIVDLFADACGQLESDPKIDYGVVVLRLDKFIFLENKGGVELPKPTLFPRESLVLRGKNDKELSDFHESQMKYFHKQFEPELRDRMIKGGYKKVVGYWPFNYLPSLIGNPIVISSGGFVSFMLWHSELEPKRRETLLRIMEEMDFQGKKPDIRYF